MNKRPPRQARDVRDKIIAIAEKSIARLPQAVRQRKQAKIDALREGR